MSKVTSVELEGSTYLMRTEYESFPTQVELCYTNQTTDHWNSSYEVQIDIDKAKAVAIIEFLRASFDL